MRLPALALTTACALLTAAFAIRAATGAGGSDGAELFGSWVLPAGFALAAGACGLRAVGLRGDRVPWSLIALALLAWGSGSAALTLMARHGATVPVPSVADALWLAAPLLFGAGVLLLARDTQRTRRPGARLDAGLGAATVAAVCVTFVGEPVFIAAERLGLAGFLTTIAYPVVDTLVVSTVFAVLVLRGSQLPRSVAVTVVGAAAVCVGDGMYQALIASGSYAPGGLLDLLWLTPSVAVSVAALMKPRPLSEAGGDTLVAQIAPVALAGIALAVLIREAFDHSPSAVTIGAAGLALMIALARMAVSLAENRSRLAETEEQTLTDPLTGLGNRRRLLSDLEGLLGAPVSLTIFDLNGFKAYNDTYGHVAGDALLERIGTALRTAVGPDGRAYRMGGDEFSAILPADVLPATVAAAMAQRGDALEITAAHGTCRLGDGGLDVTEALRVADTRMYSQKAGTRGSVGRQSADVLVAMLQERSAELGRHCDDVAWLATATARAMGLDGAELDEIEHGARLHDVGKMAIPEAIIAKPGPLDEDEWAFVRRHTVIGQRIMLAAPSLTQAAALVRSSHERFDGQGYPDGLAGEAIPLGARIIFVCDAFAAITRTRPYRPARWPSEAMEELRRHAGTQFDPAVVEAFAGAWEAVRGGRSPAGSAAIGS